ncbi:aminotransferase class V-fold PLP-dependent enzyme [Shewanella woodyi]|uniref:cysteine desulfurase n=1 Tax=Shewanella woodyi (strain ATCC 51908 / MS32) TaxID=392500 RepID=B1KR45_SHEWM|nr:aminotransferase class V-fold PLP-dependent enzyme [Shewanella woodyi]ACA84862.1 aminotransferase class V [Shewanella woodyi ATCC 51908]
MSQTTNLSQIYLDANATTPVLPQAAQAAMDAMQDLFGNPSSSHITGLKAKNLMEQTRQRAKTLLGTGEGKLIFTSGATEGIQTGILSGLIKAKTQIKKGKKYSILYGSTEHKAVPNSLAHWNEILGINAEIKAIPVDQFGKLDLEFIQKEVGNALMICTMAVNNETGVYQDLQQLEQCIREGNSKVFWLVDCVQALGKRPLNLAKTSIDYAPFSGHKLYAPKGIGFIYIREGAPFTPFIAGGGQESGLRSGTENLPGMAALNVIFQMLLDTDNTTFYDLNTLNDYRRQLSHSLSQAFPDIVFNHQFNNSVPTTLNFAVPGFSSKEIMDLFDAANIRVSSGSACSSKVTRSFVLDAMGLPVWQSESAIRLSFGPAMTQEEVDSACARIRSAAKALTNSCLMLDDTEQTQDKTPLNGLVQLRSGSSCTWVYADMKSKQALVIDPLPELEKRIDTLLQCQQLTPVAILDTHGHADHISGRVALANKYLSTQQSDVLGWPTNTKKVAVGDESFSVLTIGELFLVKVPTPGHTDDSISLLLSSDPMNLITSTRYAFCGDTILMGSLGRTNFASSSSIDMYHSLKQINRLIGQQTLLCASHDYNNEFTTTLSAEVVRNCLLQSVLTGSINQSQFAARKADLDSNLNDETGTEILCGAYYGDCDKAQIKEYSSDSLKQRLTVSSDVKILDIREPHEYALQHKLDTVSEQSSTENSLNTGLNIPMTRLVQFIQEHQMEKESEWVLVCRSGSRSMVAAQAMYRLGFTNVAHLKGGYALSS